MLEYDPNSGNAQLAADIDLVTAINARDAIGLADALECGGGSPGSLYLEHLVCSLRGDWTVEIVVRVRGRPKGDIRIPGVDETWIACGLPADVRARLVNDLRAGKLVLRRPRTTGRARGRRVSGFSPDAVDGSHILALADEIARTENWAERKAVSLAKALWIAQWRKERGLPEIRTASEFDTADRRMKRAIAAFRKLKRAVEEVQI